MMPVSNNKNLPSLGLLLPYFLLSSVSFLILAVLIFTSSNNFNLHYFQPRLLAITHIASLGFITSVIFGSLLQTLPITFQASVFSERLGKWCFYTLLTGLLGLTYSFWNFDMGIVCQSAACLLLVSFILFAINFYLSVRSTASWSIESELVSTSIIWLLTTAAIGLLLVFNFSFAFIPISHLEILKIHAHIGFIGYIFLLIQGISARLMPMFLVSIKPDEIPLKISYYLCNAGLILFAACIYLKLPPSITLLSSILILTGITFFLYYLYQVYQHRTKKHLDVGLKLTLISFIILMITLPLALIIPYNIFNSANMMNVRIIYGVLILLGFSGALILGQTLKIIPFLLWLYNLKKNPLTENPPLPKNLISEKLSKVVMNSFLLGLAGLVISIGIKSSLGIQASSVLLIISALTFNYTILKSIIRH